MSAKYTRLGQLEAKLGVHAREYLTAREFGGKKGESVTIITALNTLAVCRCSELNRPLSSCGVCDTVGVTRLRPVTPRVHNIQHSLLGVPR